MTNTRLVSEYIELVWNQGRTDLAGKYVADDLVQHNPGLPDGRSALVGFVEGFKQQVPDGRFEIRRVVAEGDLVVTHNLFTAGPDDRGTAVVDIFRISGGLIQEHWDVKESVPETTASGREIV
ncbi:nuclear transport factor 2 family protein [Sphaerisporangium fuscum]|uniref:nuclear transport factor 2 family protein n=1 Tax=Sphaerisporangium fuscum TaxID=2835868 RepID=UPI001BDBF02A|nr:nuclear transport factor 2 family protein [Sphaerisporangium fuscum]